MLVTLQKLRRTNRKVYLWLLTLGVSIKLQILQAVYLTNELRLFFFLLKKRNSGFISHVHFDLLLCLSSFLFFLSSTSALCLCLQIIFPFLTPVAFFFMSLTFIHFFLFYVPFLIVLLSTTIETVSHFSLAILCRENTCWLGLTEDNPAKAHTTHASKKEKEPDCISVNKASWHGWRYSFGGTVKWCK